MAVSIASNSLGSVIFIIAGLLGYRHGDQVRSHAARCGEVVTNGWFHECAGVVIHSLCACYATCEGASQRLRGTGDVWRFGWATKFASTLWADPSRPVFAPRPPARVTAPRV